MTLLIQMVKKRLVLSLVSVCTSILLAVVTLWWNVQLGGMIDIISKGNELSGDIMIQSLIIMLVICGISYLKVYIFGYTCEILSHDLRMGYAGYLSSLSISEIEGMNTGEQLSKLQNEIVDISGYLSSDFIQLINDIVSFTAALRLLLIINTKLTLTINLPVLAIMVYVFYSSKAISSATGSSQQAKGRMNRYADTLLTLFPLIKLYDALDMVLRGYKKEVGEWEYQGVRAERIRARLMSLSGLMSNIPLMLLLFAGGSMVINNVLTMGTLYIFINLSGNVSGVMMNMPGFIASFRRFSANMKQISTKIILAGGASE